MKKRLGWILATLIICIIASIGAVACGGGPTLKIDKPEVQLYVNEKNVTVKATLDPADKSARFVWEIEDEGVATIKPTQSICVITPVSAGETTLTVKAGEATATCTVKVGADRHYKLNAPSFTYDEATKIITINDTVNNAADVSGYELHFFNEANEDVSSESVVSGEPVDTRHTPKGVYTVRLVAVGVGELALPSDPSSSSAQIEVTLDPEYELEKGDVGALGTDEEPYTNRWAYYTGEWAVVKQPVWYDNEVTMEIVNNASENGSYAWIIQLIYNYGEYELNSLYKFDLKITSPCDGRITLGDKVVTLHEGENTVTVGFTPTTANKGLFKIKMGVDGEKNSIKEGVLKVKLVSDVEKTQITPLAVPSFAYDNSTNVITITDNVNSEYDVNYTLGFFTSATDASPVGTTTVVNGGEVDLTKVPSGNYYLKLMAASAGSPYSNSEWSAASANTVTVTNSRVDVLSGGQGVSATNPNRWYEWHDSTGNGGSGVATTLGYAYYDDLNVFHINYTVGGVNATPQPLKLHYNDSAINVGDVYELTCTVVSPMDGKITVNGQIFEVKAGEETQIKVVRRQPDKTNGGGMRTTVTIQFGASWTEAAGDGEDDVTVISTITCGDGEEIVVKNIEWHTVATTELEAPTAFVYDTANNKVTAITDGNDENDVAGYVLGLFAQATDTDPVYQLEISVDEVIDITQFVGGTYYLKLKVLSTGLPIVDSPWSEASATTLVIRGSEDTRIDITQTGTQNAINNPNSWGYFKEGGVNVDELYEDGLGNVHVIYSGAPSSNQDQPFKLFKMYASVNQGDYYTLTLKVTVAAGLFNGGTSSITVNEVIFEIHEGVNEISVSRLQPEKANKGSAPCTVTLKFGYIDDGTKIGLPAGEYTISDIEVVKAPLVALDAPTEFTFDSATDTVTSVTHGNDSDKVLGYVLGLFENATDAQPVKTLDFSVNEAIDLSTVTSGAYYLKVKVAAKALPDTDSEWSPAAAQPLVIQGEADVWTAITKTGNGGAINNPGEWSKYVDKVTEVEAKVNGLGDVVIEYTGTPTNDQPFKLMKMYANINEGDTYTLSFKFNIPVGTFADGVTEMKITVNSQIFTVHEGENDISVTRVQPKKATSGVTDPCTITIKFGWVVKEGDTTVEQGGLPAGAYTLTNIKVEKVTAE